MYVLDLKKIIISFYDGKQCDLRMSIISSSFSLRFIYIANSKRDYPIFDLNMKRWWIILTNCKFG